jgi:hypothetical protein
MDHGFCLLEGVGAAVLPGSQASHGPGLGSQAVNYLVLNVKRKLIGQIGDQEVG